MNSTWVSYSCDIDDYGHKDYVADVDMLAKALEAGIGENAVAKWNFYGHEPHVSAPRDGDKFKLKYPCGVKLTVYFRPAPEAPPTHWESFRAEINSYGKQWENGQVFVDKLAQRLASDLHPQEALDELSQGYGPVEETWRDRAEEGPRRTVDLKYPNGVEIRVWFREVRSPAQPGSAQSGYERSDAEYTRQRKANRAQTVTSSLAWSEKLVGHKLIDPKVTFNFNGVEIKWHGDMTAVGRTKPEVVT